MRRTVLLMMGCALLFGQVAAAFLPVMCADAHAAVVAQGMDKAEPAPCHEEAQNSEDQAPGTNYADCCATMRCLMCVKVFAATVANVEARWVPMVHAQPAGAVIAMYEFGPEGLERPPKRLL